MKKLLNYLKRRRNIRITNRRIKRIVRIFNESRPVIDLLALCFRDAQQVINNYNTHARNYARLRNIHRRRSNSAARRKEAGEEAGRVADEMGRIRYMYPGVDLAAPNAVIELAIVMIPKLFPKMLPLYLARYGGISVDLEEPLL